AVQKGYRDDKVGQPFIVELLLEYGKGLVGHGEIEGHFPRRPQHRLPEWIEHCRASGGLVRNGADLVIREPDLTADPDVVRELPGRTGQIADLQYRQLAQSRIEAAAVADISRQRV